MNENRTIYTVSQINEYVYQLLNSNPILRNVSISGEISGFKHHSSGHMYFQLKDENAVISCVMFRFDAMGLDFKPSDGQSVIVSGSISVYQRDGKYQMYVKQMEKQGAGDLYAEFLRLKDKLAKEGLFDESHKKQIPFLPRCVGVVTSKTGAAFRDIENIIRRRYPKMDIMLCPVAVQGKGAGKDIADGIYYMNELKRNGNAIDVLIVGRGGGSTEDLWCFNEECVARAIYESEIPIISAVGHEVDFTISDFVADLRAPTPSAAAELCVPEYEELYYTVSQMSDSIVNAIKNDIKSKRTRIEDKLDTGLSKLVKNNVEIHRMHLNNMKSDMERAVNSYHANSMLKLDSVMSKLKYLNPENVLERGYAIVKHNGKYINDVDNLEIDDSIDIMFKNGKVFADIKGIEEKF